MLDFEITSNDFRAVVKFDDGVNLYLIPNNKNHGYEQWKLTIPGGKVLVAGPATRTITIEGKLSRRTHNKQQPALHLASAWATEEDFVLSQESVDNKNLQSG